MKKKPVLICIICIVLTASALLLQPYGNEPAYGGDLRFETELAGLDGVAHVERVRDNGSAWMPDKYIVTFAQRLNWSDPDSGVFLQRVEVGLHPGAEVTVLDTSGYSISHDSLTTDDQPELCNILNANYVRIEHRFSGLSFPEGMSIETLTDPAYFLVENEAADIHRIYTSLSAVIFGDWVATGRSRGGRACLDYMRLYPEDMTGAVSYVAPNCIHDRDPRFMEFVYTRAGDAAYGSETAAEIRWTLNRFQVELMKHKEVLAAQLWTHMEGLGARYAPGMTPGRMFDLCVFELPVNFWQSGRRIEILQEILELPETTAQEQRIRMRALFWGLINVGEVASYSLTDNRISYYFGGIIHEGHYKYEYAWLQAYLELEGLEDALEEIPEGESRYLDQLIMNEEQQKTLSFVPGHYEALSAWAQSTDRNVLFIGGDLDPWSSVYVDGGDNPFFRTYICTGSSHNVRIADFDPVTRDEIVAALRSWFDR